MFIYYPREFRYSGGWSAVEATVLLLKKAVAEGEYDRYVLLQGLEYPIRINREIAEFFEKNYNTEFLKAQCISESKNARDTHKYRLYWTLDKTSVSILVKIIHFCNQKLLKYNIVPHLKKNYVNDCTGNKLLIYQGCAQFGVTRKAVEYIIEFYDNNPLVNKYFGSMFAPDESYL